jgi:hypothetical protein
MIEAQNLTKRYGETNAVSEQAPLSRRLRSSARCCS